MDTFKPCMEILPAAQQQLWGKLQPARALGLVLYGGTAIALRLGHRQSVDFDFFTDKPLDKSKLLLAFDFMPEATVLQDEPNAFTVLASTGKLVEEHVKISFFGTIAFGRIATPESSEDGVLDVAALDDLMATKVKVILQRIEAKDYRDIAAMINAGVSLSKGLSSARALFGKNFQPSESLKALVYFQGGDLDQLTPEERNTLIYAASAVRDLPEMVIASRQLSLSGLT